MTELAVAGTLKQQEGTLTPLKLETLRKGVGNINPEYLLDTVITFIKDLNVVDTSVLTSQPENALEIAVPAPSLSNAKRLREFDSTIYITGQLKEQEPESKAQGKRKIWRPKDFVALILLSHDEEENKQKVEKIILSTKLSKREMELMIRETIGEIPDNWHFNPHAAKSAKSTA